MYMSIMIVLAVRLLAGGQTGSGVISERGCCARVVCTIQRHVGNRRPNDLVQSTVSTGQCGCEGSCCCNTLSKDTWMCRKRSRTTIEDFVKSYFPLHGLDPTKVITPALTPPACDCCPTGPGYTGCLHLLGHHCICGGNYLPNGRGQREAMWSWRSRRKTYTDR